MQKTEEEKFVEEYYNLNALLKNHGYIHGAATFLSMWEEKDNEGLKKYLIEHNYVSLGTDKGIEWLYQKHPTLRD